MSKNDAFPLVFGPALVSLRHSLFFLSTIFSSPQTHNPPTRQNHARNTIPRRSNAQATAAHDATPRHPAAKPSTTVPPPADDDAEATSMPKGKRRRRRQWPA